MGSAYPALDLSSLVADLARGLRDPADIWHEHGITCKVDAKAVASTPLFRRLLADARQQWKDPGNTRERVRVRALMALEESLLDLYGAVVDGRQPLNHRVQAAQFIGKLAGLDAEAAGAAGGGGVVVNIDLGKAADGHIDMRHGAVIDAEATEVLDTSPQTDPRPAWMRMMDPDAELDTSDLLVTIPDGDDEDSEEEQALWDDETPEDEDDEPVWTNGTGTEDALDLADILDQLTRT